MSMASGSTLYPEKGEMCKPIGHINFKTKLYSHLSLVLALYFTGSYKKPSTHLLIKVSLLKPK